MASLTASEMDHLLTREEYVAKVLREAIMRGDLKPGEKLDQREIAATLKVSRTPVRNALLILSEEGLVEMTAHRGAVVAELTPEEIEEIYLIRGVLEGIAARLAASRMTPELVDNLRAVLKKMGETEDADEWMEFNNQFHSLIYQTANRPRLLALIENLRNTTRPYSREFVGTEEHRQVARAHHARILAACETRDGQQAQNLIQEHMNVICQDMLAAEASVA
jgi:DNA-binding GntR family transcriptional regulator